MDVIVGVDEAGRGAWFGNLVAAAVILPTNYHLPGLNDSKKLTAPKRSKLFNLIVDQAIAISYCQIPPAQIDVINIHQATLLAMQKAVLGLAIMPDKVIIDGKFSPELPYDTETLVGGDGLVAEISAASIIAKVIRDQQLISIDLMHPEYGFKSHKGYGTAKHLLAIKNHGVLRLHRKSYSPIAKILN